MWLIGIPIPCRWPINHLKPARLVCSYSEFQFSNHFCFFSIVCFNVRTEETSTVVISMVTRHSHWQSAMDMKGLYFIIVYTWLLLTMLTMIYGKYNMLYNAHERFLLVYRNMSCYCAWNSSFHGECLKVNRFGIEIHYRRF